MQDVNYSDFVEVLKKPGEDILASLTPEKADMIHMVFALAGEVGELMDAVKKHFAYEKPLDLDNVIEELGDIEFYLEGFRSRIAVTRAQTLEANMKKLEARYKGKYSNKAAIERADKQGAE